MPPVGLGICFGDTQLENTSRSGFYGPSRGAPASVELQIENDASQTNAWGTRWGSKRVDCSNSPIDLHCTRSLSSLEYIPTSPTSFWSSETDPTSPTSPYDNMSPIFQPLASIRDNEVYARDDGVFTAQSPIATAALSLGVVFGVLVVGLSGGILLNSHRRKTREKRERDLRLAAARASFSSRAANSRTRTHSSSATSFEANRLEERRHSNLHLVDRRSEWLRLGLDSPSQAPSYVSKSNSFIRQSDRNSFSYDNDLNDCASTMPATSHIPGSLRHAPNVPSPLRSAPVWTWKTSVVQDAHSTLAPSSPLSSETTPLVVSRKAPSPSGNEPKDSQEDCGTDNAHHESLLDEIESSSEHSTSINNAFRSPSLSSGSSDSITTHSVDTEVTNDTYDAERNTSIYTSDDVVIVHAYDEGADEAVSAQLESLESRASHESDSTSIAMKSPTTSIYLDADQQQSLLTVSFAALLSPHLGSILSSASSASLFQPNSSASFVSSIQTSHSSHLNAPAPPPTIMISPPSESTLCSHTSFNSNDMQLDVWDMMGDDLALTGVDDLPPSASWGDDSDLSSDGSLYGIGTLGGESPAAIRAKLEAAVRAIEGVRLEYEAEKLARNKGHGVGIAGPTNFNFSSPLTPALPLSSGFKRSQPVARMAPSGHRSSIPILTRRTSVTSSP